MKTTEDLWTNGAVLETAKNIVFFLSALFPIVNPLGGSPIFMHRRADSLERGEQAVGLGALNLLTCRIEQREVICFTRCNYGD